MGLFDFLGNNAGGIIGGLLGAASSGGKANETTATRDPWGPAQPYILRSLQNAQQLQDYYQKNPFNAQQRAAYDNIFADADHFRDSVAPGLMDFANRGMTSSYQRQRGGAPGSGGGYGGAVQPGGMSQSGQGPFSVARGVQQNGLLDLNGAQNPYTNGAIKPAEQKAYEAITSSPQSQFSGIGASGNGVSSKTDYNPSWSAMGDVEKANFYADNPTMAAITRALQLGWSLTDLAKLQNYLAPNFADQQAAIAGGDAFGGTMPGYGRVDLSGAFDGMGTGDISQIGVNLGQFGGGGGGGGNRGDNGGAGYGNAPPGHPDHSGGF